MPPSTQKKLIQQLKTLGYRGNPTGMCHGITSMATQAILVGDLISFDERIHFLLNYPSKKLAGDIARAKNKVREHKTLSATEQKLLEIPPFFEGIELYQKPKKHARFLVNDFLADDIKHQSFRDILPTIYPTQMENKKNNAYLAQQFINIYDKNNLEKLLKKLEKVAALNALPIPIHISANNHVIVAHYEKSKGWLFIDPNQLPTKIYKNTGEAAEKIMTAFNLKGKTHPELCMNLELYAIEPLSKKLASKLKTLQEKQIKKISSSVANKKFNNVNPRYETLLNLAAGEGNIDVVKRLLQKRSPIGNAMKLAIQFDQVEVFKIFYPLFIKADAAYETDFMGIACDHNSKKITDLLLSNNPELANARFPGKNPSPLFIALDKGNNRLVELLVNKDADIEQTDQRGFTPLLRAAYHGNYAATKMLIKKGAKTNLENKTGHTLLALAALSPNLKLVSYIIKKTKVANLNPIAEGDESLIQELLTETFHREKKWKIAEYLLAKGAKLRNDEAIRLRQLYDLTLKSKKAAELGYPHLAKVLKTPHPNTLKEHSLFKQTFQKAAPRKEARKEKLAISTRK